MSGVREWFRGMDPKSVQRREEASTSADVTILAEGIPTEPVPHLPARELLDRIAQRRQAQARDRGDTLED